MNYFNLYDEIRDSLWLRYRDVYFKMNNDDKEAFYYLTDDIMVITVRHIMDV